MHRYCYRGLEVTWLGLSLHRGALRMDKWTLQGLEEGDRVRELGPFGT